MLPGQRDAKGEMVKWPEIVMDISVLQRSN